MANLCAQLQSNPQVVCLYFAAVLLLLVLIIMQLWQVGLFQLEHAWDGAPVVGVDAAAIALGGGNSRFTADSASNRGENQSTLGSGSLYQMSKGPQHLVNNGGEPDFWTIGSELGAYRRAQSAAPAAQASPVAVANAQHFTSLGRNQHAVPGFISRGVAEHAGDPEGILMASLTGNL